MATQLDTSSQLSAVLFVMTHYPLFTFLQPVFNPHDSTLIQDFINYFSNKILWATVSNAILQPRYIAATLFLLYANPENGEEAITFVWHDLLFENTNYLLGMVAMLFQIIFTLIIFIPLF